MNPSELVNFVSNAGIAGLTLILWYLERQERLKLEVKLEDCLRGQIPRGEDRELAQH